VPQRRKLCDPAGVVAMRERSGCVEHSGSCAEWPAHDTLAFEKGFIGLPACPDVKEWVAKDPIVMAGMNLLWARL